MLENVDEPIRKATLGLIARLNGLGSVVYRGKTSCSAYIRQQRVKYGFVGFSPGKSELRIVIRADPNLYDPKGWISAKPVNWFTSREEKQEREFKITDESQIDYAFELVTQSYEFVRKREFGH